MPQPIRAVSAPPEHGPEGSPLRLAARLRRWLLRALQLWMLLVLLLALAVWLISTHLDHPAIKSRLLSLVKGRTGIALDYEGLTLSFLHGARARRLRVLPPDSFAAQVDPILSVEDVQLEANLWALASGEREISALRAQRVDISLVRDESGATTLGELFQSQDRGGEPPAPLSGALAKLPRIALGQLAIGVVGVRLSELSSVMPPRVLELSGLSLSGTLRSGPRGLEGTELTLTGKPLQLVRTDMARSARAVLATELRLLGAGTDSVALGLNVALGEQDFAPGWPAPGELLELRGSALFDARAGKVALEIQRASALAGALSLAGRAEIFDAGSFRTVFNGKASARLEALPSELSPLALEAFELDADARELSWDGARVAGAIAVRGRARRVELKSARGDLRLSTPELSGTGSFDSAGGSFRAKLTAAALTAPAFGWDTELEGIALEVDGGASESAGEQEIAARAALGIHSVTASSGRGGAVTLEGVELSTRVDASAAELAAGAARAVEGKLAARRIAAHTPLRQAAVERFAAALRLRELARDAEAVLGVRGAARVDLSLPSVRAFGSTAGVARGSARGATAVLDGLELGATLPLSLDSATGTLSFAALTAREQALRELSLAFELQRPLEWSRGARGEARATLQGRVGRFDLGGCRGALEALRVSAQRSQADQYGLELSALGAALSARGLPLPGRMSGEARADASPSAGTLRLTTALRGEQDAALDLDLDAGFERSSERLRYRAAFSARKLEAFAGFLSGLAPRAAPLSLAGARVQASLSGDLAGVLRAGSDELPVLAERPLESARGSQGLKLELAGVEYRGASRSLRIPELSVEFGSEHGAVGGGRVGASLQASSLELRANGRSLRLNGVRQELEGSFDRALDQGTLELESTLRVASLEQSWWPAYPIRRVRLSTRLAIERLRSIAVRELELNNPAAGTALRASGALELRPKGTPEGETIAGRQALALEGRLEQQLPRLESLGFAARARGRLAVPFRLESGGLLAYRLLARLEAHDVSFTNNARSLVVQGLSGVVPLVEDFVLLPTGPELTPGPRASPLADPRFFDVHPFLGNSSYLTADAITIGRLQTLGPLAANVRVDRSDFLIDQLQVGYRGGQIVGRVHLADWDGDPIVRVRLNATGVRTRGSGDVLDANTALVFVPGAMTLEGKIQLVRASRAHVEDILDVLDPYHEMVNANRVRRALSLGYPKSVRFLLHDGAVDSKVELGGLAQLVRIDEIRAVPLGPILARYVGPRVPPFLAPSSGAKIAQRDRP